MVKSNISKMKEDLIILAIKNNVLFPNTIIPIALTKESTIDIVQKAEKEEKSIAVIAQKHTSINNPIKDLYSIGTKAKVLKIFLDKRIAILQGDTKIKIEEIIENSSLLLGKFSIIEKESLSIEPIEDLILSIREISKKLLKLNPNIPENTESEINNIKDPHFLINLLCSNLSIETEKKQSLLEIDSLEKQGSELLKYLHKEIKLLKIKNEIQYKTSNDIDKQQRDYFLRQQMKVLQNELGVQDHEKEIIELKEKSLKKRWPLDAKEHFSKSIEKLNRMNPASPDYANLFNYCEFLLELPWDETTKDNTDLHRSQKILDKDHYGLEDIKERIIEYMAVMKLKNNLSGPIICLHGPPGVGKTSLGKSIARSLNRKYARISLGGMRDEAEIKGHRKTYIGAMSGKILQQLHKIKSSNPVFILDEIDKIESDFRGDPSSALLEVLDPEQNSNFIDNYLEISYDLSKVLFIATANNIEFIQPALRDRLEMIEINGYTEEEKAVIAKKYLLPKQKKVHSLKPRDLMLRDEAINMIIHSYTRESGVRDLERKIAKIARKTAKHIALKEPYSKTINSIELEKVLKKPLYNREIYQDNSYIGMAMGLAWTPFGGEVLFIESSLSKGKGKLILSGHLGDVIKESAMAALSYLKSNSDALKIPYNLFIDNDLHIHFPEGATPKDGPSAGITILTSLSSLYMKRKIKKSLAMTGEITLLGKVLPVGGIKEKLLAARRSKIEEIILCRNNTKDLEEIDEKYLKDLSITLVSNAQEVINHAILN